MSHPQTFIKLYYMIPKNLYNNSMPVKVACQCKAFELTFQLWNVDNVSHAINSILHVNIW